LSPEWSRVQLAGQYDEAHTVTIINRSQNGSAGYDIAVPFVNQDGTTILVNRGFVPLAVKQPTSPTGKIRIVGYLRTSQARSAVGAIDSTSETNREFQRFDLPLIAKATDTSLLDTTYLQLIKESVASPSQWPATVIMPVLDEGPHLSYAVQWFFFSAVALTAWVLVVRRKLREPLSDPSAPE
jgi:cytochrome oxidase assembly protein ShyY1